LFCQRISLGTRCLDEQDGLKQLTRTIDNPRFHKRSLAQRAVGWFAVVCLNLVLQPCAMAMDSIADHDCPHCPPSLEMGHEGHGGGHGGMASTKMPCATSATDCSVVDDLNYDGRSTKLEPKDSPNELPLAIHPAIATVPSLRSTESFDRHRNRSPPPGNSTPLNILYCVYLD